MYITRQFTLPISAKYKTKNMMAMIMAMIMICHVDTNSTLGTSSSSHTTSLWLLKCIQNQNAQKPLLAACSEPWIRTEARKQGSAIGGPRSASGKWKYLSQQWIKHWTKKVRLFRMYVCMCVCMYVCMYVSMRFLLVMHAPLKLCNTTCYSYFIHC
jgi:hypothetical protein